MNDLMLLVLGIVAVGYLLRRAGIVRGEASRGINWVVVYLLLPPLIFSALQRATLSWMMLLMPALAWGTLIGGIALSRLLARGLKLDPSRSGALTLALVFGNTTYFGYPIIEGFFGPHHLTLAIFYDQLGAAIAVNTLGVIIASSAGERRARPREILLRLARFPPLWAMALGLAFNGVHLPAPLDTGLRALGSLTSPLIMFSIGLSLRLSAWREDLRLVSVAAFGKLIVLPLLVLGFAWAVKLPTDYAQVAVLQAAMPTMFYSLSLSLLFGLRVNLVVNTIMVTTLLSFVTLPLWHLVIGP